MGTYESSTLDKREDKVKRGQKKGRKLVKEDIEENLTIHMTQSEVLAQRKCIWQSRTIERNSSTFS